MLLSRKRSLIWVMRAMEMNDLISAVQEHLPWIDEMLEDLRMPVHKRALSASIVFVQECIVEVRGTTKEELLRSDHFATIVNYAIDWYSEKYGQLIEAKEGALSGIARYHKQPVRLNIPITTNKVEKVGETAWFTFPDHLQSDESHFSMFDIEINLGSLSEKEIEALKTEVEYVVGLTRRTRISLMTASYISEDSRSMAGSVWAHVETAITYILSQKRENFSLAAWELFFAVEKILKVYISQFPGEKCRGHKLIDLCKQANGLGLQLDDASFAGLPESGEAIKMRYCEMQVDPREVVEVYLNVLKLVCSIAFQLERKWSIFNASFLIKKASWAR